MGHLALCTLGNPYNTPGREPHGLIFLYVESSMNFFFRKSNRKFVKRVSRVLVKSLFTFLNFEVSDIISFILFK